MAFSADHTRQLLDRQQPPPEENRNRHRLPAGHDSPCPKGTAKGTHCDDRNNIVRTFREVDRRYRWPRWDSRLRIT